ncbi:hypothetical protein [Caldicellulosiruptor naganoensis]|uniref:Uncharacterized protein n=1 Tax=Caldicellulosiruptor naganoensis TaxID=29324 RepID=A0ABY7BIH7_9FIRM|nr:hypothetical protein [Caldicellulosiruptor naganoensis]WAM31515.1 hypothetical protein OTJ99_002404 [Caldicellulosiruptor naganoensis]
MENRNVALEVFLWLVIYLCFFAGVNLFSSDKVLLFIWSVVCTLAIFLITIAFRFYITSTLLVLPGFLISCLLAIFFMFNVRYSPLYNLLLQIFSIHLMGFVEYVREAFPRMVMQRPVYVYVHVGLNLVLFLIHIVVLYLLSESSRPKGSYLRKLDLTYTPRRKRY